MFPETAKFPVPRRRFLNFHESDLFLGLVKNNYLNGALCVAPTAVVWTIKLLIPG